MGNSNKYLAVGTVLNSRYRIVRYIKSGGFGNTYEAEDLNFDGMRVAITELFIGEWCSRGDDALKVSVSVEQNRKTFARHIEKFKSEAILLRKLSNTGIVRVIDVFEANGTAYYAMDYIEGGSLAMRLKEKGGKAMGESEVRGYLCQILDALEYVHKSKCYHLDLKPGNIMVDETGKIVLIDFGASKNIEDENGNSVSLSSIMACTPGYAPPEQMDGEKQKMGTHTDMYALGATLYNLLTGEIPPKSSDIIDSGLPAIDGISDTLQSAIEGLMQPSVKKRIKTVSELREVLSQASSKESPNVSTKQDTADAAGDGATTPITKKKNPSWLTWLKQHQGNIVKLLGGIIIAGLLVVGISRCEGFGASEEQGADTLSYEDSVEILTPEEIEDSYITDFISEDVPASSTSKSQEETNKAAAQPAQQESEPAKEPVRQNGVSTSKEVDLGLSVNWAGWNVGASSPEEYGDLFAWGETSPKSGNYTESTYRYHNGNSYVNIGSNISGTQYDAARANWGGSWRMPTKAESEELKNRCTWKWTTYKGINGMKVTGPNGNSIFLPAAGCRNYTLDSRGSIGYYWSGSLYESHSSYAWRLYFDGYGSDVGYGFREYGRSVRPVKAR